MRMVGVKVGMNATRLDTAYDDAIFETELLVYTRSLNPKIMVRFTANERCKK